MAGNFFGAIKRMFLKLCDVIGTIFLGVGVFFGAIYIFIFDMIRNFFKFLSKVRFQKIAVTMLYFLVFATIVYTFWIYWFVGETVNPEIYAKTMEVLLGLLGTTAGMRITESITDTVRDVGRFKYSAEKESTDDMRGGE